jgi:predicted ArsR family transcriptional regulator
MATLQKQARALGDPTRHAIFRYVARSEESVDVAELTELFRLNTNAIRQHLAKLLEVGLITETTARPGRPGRPRLLYDIAPGVESRWGVTGPYEQLTLLLAEIVRTGALPVEVGRSAGRAMTTSGVAGGDGVRRVADAMVRQGFEPEVLRQSDGAEIVLRACPWATTALADPDIVCELHRGMVEGLVEGTDSSLEDLARENPRRAGCHLLVHREPDSDERDRWASPVGGS